MNYNTLYKISPKLDRIYQKLLNLDKYDFDYSKLKKEIDMFDEKLASIKEESNNMMGAEVLKKPDERLLDDLSLAIDNFEKYIDSILASFNIFEHYKIYELQINDVKDVKELDNIVAHILNDLLGYKTLLENGLKENKEINSMIYKAIKKEFQLKGNSIIFNTLITYKLHNIINEFVNEDCKKYKEEIEISKRYTSSLLGVSDEQDIKDLLLLISINDDNYKEKIKRKFDSYEKTKQTTNKSIKINEDEIKEVKSEINGTKKEKNGSTKELMKIYLSFITSIGILAGAGFGIHAAAQPKTRTFYRIEKECVDTVSGSYDTTTYSETYDNEVVLKVYSEADAKGDRQVQIYAINDRYDDINDYLNYEPNESELISEKSINDGLINNKSTDEFKTVEVIKDINLESTVEKKSGVFLLWLYEIGLLAAWVVINSILSSNDLGGAFYIFGEEFGADLIDNIRDKNKRIKEKLKELEKLDNTDSELKAKLTELEKWEKELDDKYKIYLDMLRKEKENQKKLTI